MFVPFITKRTPANSAKPNRRYRRKGGGGRGGGGRGGGGKSGSTGTGGGKTGTSSFPGSSSPSRGVGSVSVGGTSRSASAGAWGGGAMSTIPAGLPHAGRTVGGGSRNEIYGSRGYGSGYPGVASASRGVSGFGFPFVFWPVVWLPPAGWHYGHYYYNQNEYGNATNTTRPGGALASIAYTSTALPSGNTTTFRIFSDSQALESLKIDISEKCGSFLSSTDKPPLVPFTGTSNVTTSTSPGPRPEQVIQYYRASSVALSLDGYNNTAVFSNTTINDMPLPTTIHHELLNCLNNTIADRVPLVDPQWETGPSDGDPFVWSGATKHGQAATSLQMTGVISVGYLLWVFVGGFM